MRKRAPTALGEAIPEDRSYRDKVAAGLGTSKLEGKSEPHAVALGDLRTTLRPDPLFRRVG
jgi:hypothetical protein